jgi:hypothetical protein
MIVGAQKAGTTALAHFLDQHPAIGMASPKEPHLFDVPTFPPQWTAEEVDARYEPSFTGCPGGVLRGEATPIYLLFEDIAAELKRYNPELKVIELLRDRVERAISQYYMERGRGNEWQPLWLALLLEPVRLWRCRDPRLPNSAMRRHSYRTRGLYSRQIRNLYRCFDDKNVLLITSQDLKCRHDEVLTRVFRFLGVTEDVRIAAAAIFEGDHRAQPHRVVSWLLRLSYLLECWRFRRYRRLLQ